MDESEESPLDLKAQLNILESETSSDEQVLNVYLKLSHHISKELSIFELDFVEQGRRLLTVTKKHVTSDRGFKNSITPKALNVMSFCVGVEEIGRSLSSEEVSELVAIWSKIIAETKQKFTCAYAFRCLTSQKFTDSTMGAELPGLMNAFSRASTLWWGKCALVEYEAMHTIQRLGEQCPRVMKRLCGKWGPLYLRLLVSESLKTRELAYSRLQKWTKIMASSKEFVHVGVSTVTKQIAPVLHSMFTSGEETFAMKTCMLLLHIFKQELHNISLINSLLSIQELAFRCSSSEVRCQAFQSWGVLIDILADKGILKKTKFVELIMRVFKTRNTNTEEVAMAKLTTWWRYVQYMGPSIWLQFEQILRPLLQFCLGNARLGSESVSSVGRAIHDPSGDPVPGTCSSPVVLPTFPKVQQGGLDILVFLFHDGIQPPASLLELEPLKNCPVPLDVFIKSARFLISAMVEVTKLFASTNESQVVYVWERTTDFVLTAVSSDRDERNSAVSSFLFHFQALLSSKMPQSSLTMKLFKLVCSLPPEVLSSPSLTDGSLFKCRAQSLCELLLSSSLLADCGHEESFVTIFLTLVKCGIKRPGATLPFLECIGKLLDTQAASMSSTEVLWRLWSIVANKLQDYMSSTNEVDQDDRLEPNFGCLYTVLLLPVTYLLGPRVSQGVNKATMRTLIELYHTFARLAALVTTAKANVIVEEFSQKIMSKAAADSYEKDLLTLEHLAELCQAMVADFDFSFLDTANPFMKGIRATPTAKHHMSFKPLDNLHSFVSLLAQLLSWVLADVEKKKDKPTADELKESKGREHVGSCYSKLMDVLTKLFTSINIPSLIAHLMEKLSPSLTALLTAIPKKLPAKICLPAFMQKLDRLWEAVYNMLHRHFKGRYDSDMLHHMAPLFVAAFTHPRRAIKNQTVQLWNNTFGAASAPLTYPADLQGVLAKIRAKVELSLPGWTLQDVAIVDEISDSQMSQMDSQAPEPVLFGVPLPARLRGSFLNKDVSPKPGTSSAKRILRRSVTRRSAISARKKLPLECFPQKDFVVITDTPKKRRVLTEHQKEVLQEKRDLPAMYNSLEASQDMNLSAYFSLDSTQQDSMSDMPIADNVIVVNSSQSQQKEVNTDQPSEELPAPRRNTRRSSVRFDKTEASELDFKNIGVKTPKNKPEIISLSESLSQDLGQKLGDEDKSLNLPPPQPNVLADCADRLIDTSSSRDTSQSVGLEKSSHQSSSRNDTQPNKRRTRSQEVKSSSEERISSPEALNGDSVQRRAGGDEDKEEKNSNQTDNGMGMSDKALKKVPQFSKKQPAEHIVLAEETNSPQNTVTEITAVNMSIQETPTKISPSTFQYVPSTDLNEGNTENGKCVVQRLTLGQQLELDADKAPQPGLPENSPSISLVSSVEDASDQGNRFTLQPPVVCDEIASQGFPVHLSVVESSSEDHKKSRDFVSQDHQERPNALLDKHAELGFLGLLKQTCDVGSNGHKVTTVVEEMENGHKATTEVDKIENGHKATTVVDKIENGHKATTAVDKMENSHKASTVVDKMENGHKATTVVDKMENGHKATTAVDKMENSHKASTVVGEMEDDISIHSEASSGGTYDPQLTSTLRQTPLPRRSSRFRISEKTDESDSQKSVGGGSSKSISSSHQKLHLSDSPVTFDPTKDSTLGEITQHSRKRKQQTPKKIADPALLRRTSRKKLEKNSTISCSKTKARSPTLLRRTSRKKSEESSLINCSKTKARSQRQICSSPKKKLCNGLPSKPSNKSSRGRLFRQKIHAKQQVRNVNESKKNNGSETLEENLKTKPVDRSPHDLGEVTPETKTSCTSLRHSTTERKKKAAKHRSTLKPIGSSMDNIELDCDDSNHASQLKIANKPKKARRDVFDSKKDNSEDDELDDCAGITDMPSSTVFEKNVAETCSSVSASKLKLKRAAAQKLNANVRSPPRLRLRQKKKALSNKDHDGKKPLSEENQQEALNGSDGHNHDEESGKVRKSGKKMVELDLTSKKQAELGKDIVNGNVCEKEVNAVPFVRSTSYTAVLTSRERRRQRMIGRGMTHNPLKKKRKDPQSAHVLAKAVGEEGSEEVVIEQYESYQWSADESDHGRSQGDHLPNDTDFPVGTDTTSAVSQCLQPSSKYETTLATECSKMVVCEKGEGKPIVCASPQNTDFDQGPDADMSVEFSEVIPDSCKEVEMDTSTTSCPTSLETQLSFCDSVGSDGVEGSEDMTDNNDDDQETSPLSVPFLKPARCEDDDRSVIENKEIGKISMSPSHSEEDLELDIPHNQMGIEAEQESLMPVVKNKCTAEQKNEDMVHIIQDNIVQGTDDDTTSVSEVAEKLEEISCPTAIPSIQITNPGNENQTKSCKRKVSKTELFELIDQSDVTVEEIMDYLQNKLRNKKACHNPVPVAGDLDEPPEAGSSGMESSHCTSAPVLACPAGSGTASCQSLVMTASGDFDEIALISGDVDCHKQSEDCSSVGTDTLDGISAPVEISTSTCVSLLETPADTTASGASSHSLSSLVNTSIVPQSTISEDQPGSSTSSFSSNNAACSSKMTPDSVPCSTPRSSKCVLWNSSSPGILKRRFDDSGEEPRTPTPSKARRVCFANPVEVGQTPTCEECGGVPDCEKCLEDCKWYRRHRTATFKPRRKSRWLRRKQRKELLTWRRRLDGVTGIGNNNISDTAVLINVDMIKKSILINSPGECSSSPKSTPSQQDSENASPNSYHSTQESQLNCTDPVFPELVDCTDDFGAVLGGLTMSAFGVGLKSILLAKGLKTVGHLASLAEAEVEKLPLLKPKTETLKNVLKQYLQQKNPLASPSYKSSSKATEPDGSESSLQRKGIPTGSFYKKSSVPRNYGGTSDKCKRKNRASAKESGPSHEEVGAQQEKGDSSLSQDEAAQVPEADTLSSCRSEIQSSLPKEKVQISRFGLEVKPPSIPGSNIFTTHQPVITS